MISCFISAIIRFDSYKDRMPGLKQVKIVINYMVQYKETDALSWMRISELWMKISELFLLPFEKGSALKRKNLVPLLLFNTKINPKSLILVNWVMMVKAK